MKGYPVKGNEFRTPRVGAITRTVHRLLSEHEDEKVIVASTSVLFLDIVFRAICGGSHEDHRGRKPGTLRYDGSIHPDVRATNADALNRPVDVAEKKRLLDSMSMTMEREDILKILSDIEEAEGYRVLLLDAHVAGSDLSLTGASRIIFCEQFWTPGLADKVIGCVQRFPQEKPVHVYQVFDGASDIDVLMREMVRNKYKSTPGAAPLFTRLDKDAVRVPSVPTREEHDLALQELSKNKATV